MPTYRFYNSKTKTEFEDYMSISDMEKFTKKNVAEEIVFSFPGLVLGSK